MIFYYVLQLKSGFKKMADIVLAVLKLPQTLSVCARNFATNYNGKKVGLVIVDYTLQTFKNKFCRFPVITLCGSTKFKDTFELVNKQFTMEGFVVLSVGVFGHSDPSIQDKLEQIKPQLDVIHKQKIDMADAIFVINVDGYIGKSTQSEIEYAKRQGKKVFYLEEKE